MTQRRQSFRLRWLFGFAGRPSTEPLRPKDRSKSPTHSDTNVPIQRSTSPPKPPVITTVEFPPSPIKTKEPQKQSPPHPTQPPTTSVIIGSSVPSQSTTSTPFHSPRPSQSKTSTPFHSPWQSFQPAVRADSPSQISIASSSPKTPPKSPSHLASNGIIEVAKPAVEESRWPGSLAFEQEKEKKVVSKPIPQEAEAKVSSPLKVITESPETPFQPERVSIQPQDSEQQASSVPSTPVSKTKPAFDQPPPPSSPLAATHTGEVLKGKAEESTLPTPLASQEEKEKMVEAVSEPVSQEVESKINSPLKTIPKSPETPFQHERIPTQPQDSEQQASSMPQFMVSKTKPDSDQPPLPLCPLASEHSSEGLKPKAEESTLPASSASQEEKEKMTLAVSEPVPQEAEPKMKSPLKTIPKLPESSSKPENLYTQPTPIIGDEERSATPETKKLDLDRAAGSSKTPLETQSKLLESEEKEKEVHKPIKARKAKDIITGLPTRHTIASTSGTNTKYPFSGAFRADTKRHGAHEIVEKKMMFATSKPREKDIRFVGSADSGTRDVSSISPEKAPLHKGIKDDVSKFVHKIATVDPTQPVDDKQFSVIALAGDNRGATMQVGSELAKEDGSVHIHQVYKADPKESTEVTTDVEESTKTDSLTKHDAVEKAYVNSNIQSINNSLMVHGSITEKDPGVQVTLPQNPAEPISPHDKKDMETHKVESAEMRSLPTSSWFEEDAS